MAVVIRGGDGSGFQASVTSDFRLEVESVISGTPLVAISGGIHIGSVSANVDSIYIQSGNNVHLGSAWNQAGSVLNLYKDSSDDLDSPLVADGSYLMMAGSISSIPDISIETGSEVWAGVGSVVISGTSIPPSRGIGSVHVANRVPGSIVNLPDVVQSSTLRQITAGSVIVTGVTAGSLESFQATASELNVTVANLSTAGSVETQGVSGTAFNTVWLGTGSVVISGTSIPPSRGVGSVVISGTSIPVFRGIGSVLTTGVGSVVISGTSIPVSRGTGSVVISGTSVPVSRGVGSVLGLFTDSSNNLDSPLVADGSYIMVAGSISSMPIIDVSEDSVAKPGTAGLGSMTIIAGFSGGVAMPLLTTAGSILQTDIITSPLPVSGNALGVSGTAFQQVWVGTGSVVVSGTAAVNVTTGSVRLLSTTGSVSIYYDNDARGEVDSNIQIGNADANSTTNNVPTSGLVRQPAHDELNTNANIQVGNADVNTTTANMPTSGLVRQPTHDNLNANANIQIGNTDASDSNPVPISGNALGVSGTAFQQVWVGTGSVVISGTSVPVSRGVGSVVISGTSIPVSRGIGSVLALFTDSANTLDSPLVADGSYLMFAGSISSIPSITATNESVAKPGTAGLGSVTIIAGFSGGVAMPLRTTNGSDLVVTIPDRVPGSIVNLPIGSNFTLSSPGSIATFTDGNVGSVVISGTSIPVSRGVGSVVISGTSIPVSRGIGSVLGLFTDSANTLDSPLVADGSYLMIAGSISSIPSITATNESVAKPGTAGLGSMTIIAGFSGGDAMPLLTTAGSILQVDVTTSPLPVSGNALGVSGTAFESVWTGVGSVVISGTSIPVSRGVGSVVISGTSIPPFRGVGSILTVSSAGSIGVYAGADTVFGVSGNAVGISGVVNQGTTPWVTTEPVVEQDYSGVTFITTGSKLIWSPAAGSKAQIKAFSISSDVPQHLTLYFSGTAAPAQRQIWSNRMPASGTAAMNLFGITCSGPVDAALGAVVNVGGSIDITVFCRSLK